MSSWWQAVSVKLGFGLALFCELAFSTAFYANATFWNIRYRFSIGILNIGDLEKNEWVGIVRAAFVKLPWEYMRSFHFSTELFTSYHLTHWGVPSKVAFLSHICFGSNISLNISPFLVTLVSTLLKRSKLLFNLLFINTSFLVVITKSWTV